MLDLEKAKLYITDQFNESIDRNSGVAWLEGWIHGYTDFDHKYHRNDEAKEILMDHLESLRE